MDSKKLVSKLGLRAQLDERDEHRPSLATLAVLILAALVLCLKGPRRRVKVALSIHTDGWEGNGWKHILGMTGRLLVRLLAPTCCPSAIGTPIFQLTLLLKLRLFSLGGHLGSLSCRCWLQKVRETAVHIDARNLPVQLLIEL